jgi:hypothetical protein
MRADLHDHVGKWLRSREIRLESARSETRRRQADDGRPACAPSHESRR